MQRGVGLGYHGYRRGYFRDQLCYHKLVHLVAAQLLSRLKCPAGSSETVDVGHSCREILSSISHSVPQRVYLLSIFDRGENLIGVTLARPTLQLEHSSPSSHRKCPSRQTVLDSTAYNGKSAPGVTHDRPLGAQLRA